MCRLAFQRALGGIADQPARIVHLVHYAVAGVDTGAAADAVELQAVADINSGRAHLDANLTVNAVTQARSGMVDGLLAWSAGFATGAVVGDDQSVLVEHDALKAGVGAHVQADFLTQPTCVEVSGSGEKEQPEGGADTQLQVQHVADQFAHRGEITDKGNRSGQADYQPDTVFGAAPRQFVE